MFNLARKFRNFLRGHPSAIPCIFCLKPVGDNGVMDLNGAMACKPCADAELKTQKRERAAQKSLHLKNVPPAEYDSLYSPALERRIRKELATRKRGKKPAAHGTASRKSKRKTKSKTRKVRR